ncbi:ATP-dependent helicase C-terminal domain-containing protein, partial [Streptomyces bambusae]|uniref:ATP-dependent helicase C-terminal domain-containing protein n=1 Tax=Streptomyces bambusae TaxID=1550616 RepID=UPI0027DF3F66
YAARWRAESARLRRALSATAGGSAGAGAGAGAAARGHFPPPPLPETGAVAPDFVRGLRPRTPAPQTPPATAGRGPQARLELAAPCQGRGDLSDDATAGLVAALAFPERVAKARSEGSYLMANGTGAALRDGSALRHSRWLAVAVADRPSHATSAQIRLGAVIDERTAREAAAHLLAVGAEVHWEDGDVVAREVERLGAVELTVRPLREPDPALVREALLEGLRRDGLGLLRWSADATALRARLGFLHRTLGAPWPDVQDDDALLARADDWLEPELSRARRRADLARIDAGQALTRLLPWATGEAARLDELAPERIEVPSGSRIRLDYGGEQPVLAVKLQELFGLARTPEVAGVPVLVHLLSPAGRPAAVTADLASFWQGGYRAVRAELRGRYPKHPWPEDPATAEPTRHTNARLRRG